MNRQTLYTELKLISRSPAVLPLGIGLLLCFFFSVQGGAERIQERQADTAKTLHAEEEEWAKQKSEYEKVYAGQEPMPSFGIVNYINAHAFLPPGPLALLSTGQEDLHPRHAKISLWQREDKLFDHYEIDSPMLLREGTLDFTFLVVVLMPIAIIALTYNVLSADRESGRMALIRIHAPSVFEIGLRRVLLRGGLIVLGILALLALSLFYGAFTVGLNAQGWLRAAIWAVLIIAYALPWIALALALNTRDIRSETNALILGGTWALLVLVVPTLTSALADAMLPAPSRLDHMVAARQLENDVRARGEDNLSKYFEDHPDLAGDDPVVFDDFFKAYYAVHRRIEGELAPQLDAYQVARQERWTAVSRMALLSPPALMQSAMESVAGSGHARAAAFQEQVKSFSRDWHALLAPTALGGERIAPEAIDDLPRFEFAEPGIASSIALVLQLCALCGGIALALALLARRSPA